MALCLTFAGQLISPIRGCQVLSKHACKMGLAIQILSRVKLRWICNLRMLSQVSDLKLFTLKYLEAEYYEVLFLEQFQLLRSMYSES